MISEIVAFSCILVAVLAAPPAAEPVAIVVQNSDIQPDGSFQWNFEAADGTKQEQSGALKAGATPEDSIATVQGAIAWVDPEGNQHELKYVADENGFQPQGADLPVPPEIPAQIARALEYIAAHPQPEENAS
ncbi:endocuticle structural glycoprotein ABD-4-like [Anthonomus grandis grandis]|uniref:endocuticle structural glycoprotein ABD-4-like n=1 Tax=Anthonomus grandis grandis TaxID=2921223 RepID=UPI0021652DB5|nr:endocuticle structural glycoprotein ABD-4-like [Anthonomus grandis grandis]